LFFEVKEMSLMKYLKKQLTILMADDDQDDCLLIKEAFLESSLTNTLRFVEDGEALLDYLFRRGKYADELQFPYPDLILLDLNMPKKDGREALREIKSHPDFRRIPIVILTTSKEEEDIHKSYTLGANSFITKPVSFQGLVEMVRSLGLYWFDVVELPPEKEGIEKWRNNASESF
jgi:CheY-like chemotaxis protein